MCEAILSDHKQENNAFKFPSFASKVALSKKTFWAISSRVYVVPRVLMIVQVVEMLDLRTFLCKCKCFYPHLRACE